MAKKKLSTAEILAAARAEVKGSGAADAPQETAATPDPSPPAKTASAGGAPKSTADILAAARAQTGGEASTPAAKPSKPAAKPTSTADILAAARAQTGGGKAEKSAAPAPQKGTATPAPATASGEHPSVQEMLQAVRSGKQVEEADAESAAPAKPQPPVRPQRPVVPVKADNKKGTDAGRRSLVMGLLMSPFVLAWIMIGGVLTAWGLGLARFMMPNVLVEPPSKFKIGPASDYPVGTVSTKWKAEFGIWVVNTDWAGEGSLVALSTVCTHLGCTPNWLGSEQKFKCPCHGSGFYITGVNFEGPAPRPLERHGIKIAADGMVEVDKSIKFQEELGQWADGGSYIKTS